MPALSQALAAEASEMSENVNAKELAVRLKLLQRIFRCAQLLNHKPETRFQNRDTAAALQPRLLRKKTEMIVSCQCHTCALRCAGLTSPDCAAVTASAADRAKWERYRAIG
jgi:hypothetical protein